MKRLVNAFCIASIGLGSACSLETAAPDTIEELEQAMGSTCDNDTVGHSFTNYFNNWNTPSPYYTSGCDGYLISFSSPWTDYTHFAEWDGTTPTTQSTCQGATVQVDEYTYGYPPGGGSTMGWYYRGVTDSESGVWNGTSCSVPRVSVGLTSARYAVKTTNSSGTRVSTYFYSQYFGE